MTFISPSGSGLSTRVTEIALRKVYFNIFKDKMPLDNVQTEAVSHIKSLVHGAEDAKKQLNGMGWQEGLVMAAITGIAISVNAGLEQLKHLGSARLDFDKELKAGHATFLIPKNKEYRNYSTEEAGIDAYLTLCQEHEAIFPYLGLDINTVTEGKGGKLISVLPFFKMSQKIPQKVASDSLIDKVNQAISLFFQSEIHVFLQAIDTEFSTDSKFVDFFKSAWEGDNFLNNYRHLRIVMMSVAVLVWHLQNPIDFKTGTELTLEEKIELCDRSFDFINDLLNKNKKPNIDKLDSTGSLRRFVLCIETFILRLKDGYEEEKNKRLTLDAVCIYAQRATTILNENIFYIIYRKAKQSSSLAFKISYLTMLLERDPDLLSVLSEFDVTHDLINDTPTTIIDLLLVYTQLKTSDKLKFEQSLLDWPMNTRESFALTLRDVNELFIKPIYEAEKKALRKIKKTSLKNKWFNGTKDPFDIELKETALKYSFCQFLPLVGLAINDYNIPIDTDESKIASEGHKLTNKFFLTSRQQINKITELASENLLFNKNAFVWSLNSYLSLNVVVKDTLNILCLKQYKIGRVTNLIKSIKNFIGKYHSFLLNPEFKAFIIRCFTAINNEFYDLQELCALLKKQVNSVNTEDRSMITQIKNMEQDLNSEIASFMTEVKKNSSTMLSEHFEDNIKNEILYNLTKISTKFASVFGYQDVSFNKFIGEKQGESKLRGDSFRGESFSSDADSGMPQGLFKDKKKGSAVFYKQRSALSALIFDCYLNMSYFSQQGIKGEKLLALSKEVASKSPDSGEHFNLEAIALSKIVCAYRPSLLFQADYAHTRSSETLIKAIIASTKETDFPLYDWIFEERNTLEKEAGMHTVNSISEKLLLKKELKIWPKSTKDFDPNEPKENASCLNFFCGSF